MITYGYYIEGISNGIRIRHVIEGCRTRSGIKRKVARYLNTSKVCDLGHVLFTFNGSERKYFKDNYKVIERFNAKAFFEYWD